MTKGILIIGHGSKSGLNEEAAEMHAEHLRRAGFENVYHAFKGYSEPRIGDTLLRMASDGIRDIAVIPLFIASGHYADSVIPKRVGLRKSEREGTVQIDGREARVRIAETFGSRPSLTGVIEAMLREASAGPGDAVLLIGHGSKSRHNREMVELNAERLRERTDLSVSCAFNEFNEPSVEDALEAIAGSGARRVVAVPMFVSSGEHTDRDIPEKLGLAPGERSGSVRGMDVAYLAPVGSRPETGAVLEDVLRGIL
ncbi:MAG: hypothetical protein LBG62_05705 [Candidatus Methanoplasma sp.]|jgi:sirohydrochlorin cobaltochelatase|nr:hypothetical protein [Candidatus Methanoplasma sp.]